MTHLYFDLETLPCQDPDLCNELVETAKAPANYKKPESIEKWREGNRQNIIDKTSFDGGLGHICQINAVCDDRQLSASLGGDIGEEKSGLIQLVSFMERSFPSSYSGPILTGHNINGFDIPFLWKRAIVLGVKLPHWFPKNPKPWSTDTFDTMLRWDSKNFISQDRLARILGIQGKQGMDGSKVHAAWQAGEHDKIAKYCADDVQTVKAIHEKMERAGL